MPVNPHATVLHVEDDEVARKLLRKAFDRVEGSPHLVQVPDADTAGKMLGGQEVGPPLVLLVDLSVPGMYGGDFLATLREDPVLGGTPVFILSASQEPEHVESAYAHHAAGYIVKPNEPEETIRLVEFLTRYVDLVRLPNG